MKARAGPEEGAAWHGPNRSRCLQLRQFGIRAHQPARSAEALDGGRQCGMIDADNAELNAVSRALEV